MSMLAYRHNSIKVNLIYSHYFIPPGDKSFFIDQNRLPDTILYLYFGLYIGKN